MVNPQLPVKSISIENLLAQRNAMVERVSQAIAALTEAASLGESSGISGALTYRGFDYILGGRDHYRGTGLLNEGALAEITKRLDASTWQHLLHESGIRTLMDAKARAEWDKKIEECDVPELTRENIGATFGMLYDTRGEIFERGVVNAFRNLSWCYKTNRPFAFGKRIVVRWLRSAVSGKGDSLGWPTPRKCDELDDLVRVFSVMDGKPEPDHRQGMAELLGYVRANPLVENDYLVVRSFRNGNGHVTFKRPDLVAKMNRILAKHYPAMLPADRHEDAREFDAVKVA